MVFLQPHASRPDTSPPGTPLPYKTLDQLNAAVVDCSRCPELRTYCAQVAATRKAAYRDQAYWGRPLPSHGDPQAGLLVVGLAPGAHGGNRTGRMFTGDDSATWLAAALHEYGFANQPTSAHAGDGLMLRDAYITNSVRCAPPGNRPTPAERAACLPYLTAEMKLLTNLKVVLPLGEVAFRAVAAILGEPRLEWGHGLVHRLPGRPTVIASYHPSRQNTNTGRLTREMWLGIFAAVRRELAAGAGEPADPVAQGSKEPARQRPAAPARAG